MKYIIILLVLVLSACGLIVPRQEQEDISSYRYDVPIEMNDDEEEKEDGK